MLKRIKTWWLDYQINECLRRMEHHFALGDIDAAYKIQTNFYTLIRKRCKLRACS